MNVLKAKVGALIIDAPLYIWKLLLSYLVPYSWIHVKNRQDNLIVSNKKNDTGVDLNQAWSSDLYLPKIYPIFGYWIFMQANRCHSLNVIAEDPRGFKPDAKDNDSKPNFSPQVSFIIGHRGEERIPLLFETISSIAAQNNCRIECIVVEQDNVSLLKNKLPSWVQHIFTPITIPDMPFSRSMAFNIGANHAKGECLILHDNDMIISNDYAYEVLQKHQQGYDFINLKRFIFYLSEKSTCSAIKNRDGQRHLQFEAIMQNSKGGGSIGASRQSYFDIGGFDERFIGWGGEDNEFWERACTSNPWEFGFMPLLHLWHAPQAEKLDLENSDTKALYNKLSKLNPEDRIAWLKKNQSSTNVVTIPVAQ